MTHYFRLGVNLPPKPKCFFETDIGVNLLLLYVDPKYQLVEVNLPLNFESHFRGKFTSTSSYSELHTVGVNLPQYTVTQSYNLGVNLPLN